jgi:hypothetical protein
VNKTSGYAVVGAIVMILLGLIILPVCIYLGAYIGVKIVVLILAKEYMAAFWWCCLYSLFYLAGAIVKTINGD